MSQAAVALSTRPDFFLSPALPNPPPADERDSVLVVPKHSWLYLMVIPQRPSKAANPFRESFSPPRCTIVLQTIDPAPDAFSVGGKLKEHQRSFLPAAPRNELFFSPEKGQLKKENPLTWRVLAVL
jgi:hypothetical protein